jgi:hypothetical protein
VKGKCPTKFIYDITPVVWRDIKHLRGSRILGRTDMHSAAGQIINILISIKGFSCGPTEPNYMV